jgi:hypothetical protein
MRLISFLSQIERAVLADAPAADGPAWTSTRMVNFHHGLARLTLTPRAGADSAGGAILLQGFALADGSLCLKASLNWHGCEVFPMIAVYSTAQTDWRREAERIAAAWREGPPAALTAHAPAEGGLTRLVALAG